MGMSAKGLARACTPRSLRNWLRAPARSAEWCWNEAKHLTGMGRAIEMRSGWRLRSHPSAYGFAYFAQDTDPDQISEFDSFIASCRAGMVLFDIGAHFGLFSLAALHYGGDAAKAVAVDPSPTATRMLKIQARLNRVEERLTVVRSAVGERVGWQPMVSTGVNGAGYFVAPGDHSGAEVVRTRSTTLDRLAEDLRLRPTHLKIDVEGYESAVLSGGRQLLAPPAAPLLFLELHNEMVRGRGGDPSETLSLLKVFGYTNFSPCGTRLSDDDILSRPLLRIVGKKAEHR